MQWGLGDSIVVKVLAEEAQGPNFDPSTYSKAGREAHTVLSGPAIYKIRSSRFNDRERPCLKIESGE